MKRRARTRPREGTRGKKVERRWTEERVRLREVRVRLRVVWRVVWRERGRVKGCLIP
jgi:hypothetical protein